MQELWQVRVRRHVSEQVKYLRLVFNDHFVLAIIFLLGALGYTYANAVKDIDPQSWWLKPLMSVILLASLSFGRVATLLHGADSVFLLPQEKQLAGYLKAAMRYSCWLPASFLASMTGLMAPTLLMTQTTAAWTLISLLVTLWLLKLRRFSVQLENWYQTPQTVNSPVWFLVEWAILMSQLFNWWALVGLVVTLGLTYRQVQHQRQVQASQLFNWLAAVEAEDSRMGRIYRLYNLFTDVPGLNSQVKRRRYLDGLIRRINGHQQNPFFFLYLRGFLRGTEFSGLYLRLVLFGGVIIWFSQIWWLGLLLSLLLIYLVGFQLLPFYQQYAQTIFTHLYPVASGTQVQAFKQLLWGLLTVQVIIFSLIIGLRFGFGLTSLASVGAMLLLMIGFVQGYLPQRLTK